MSTANVLTARRFYLLKGQAHEDIGQYGLADIFFGKQVLQTSTALPDDFPYRSELVAKRYSTVADVEGADLAELRKRVGLTRSAAEAVIAAVAAL